MSSLARCRVEFEAIAARADQARPLTGAQAEAMGCQLAAMVSAGRAAQGTVMSWLGAAVAGHSPDSAVPLENWRRVAEALRGRLSPNAPPSTGRGRSVR